jgi:peroxiredoxin
MSFAHWHVFFISHVDTSALSKRIASFSRLRKLDERDEQKGYRLESRFRLVNALIELERIDEAGAAFVELERVDTAMPEVLAGRVFLHRTLTDIYLENLQLDKAVRQAIAGFDVARRITQRPVLPDAARQARDIEGAKLIAIAIAGLERLEQKGLAEDMQRRWRQTSRGRPAQSETVFESELATQRLIGRPVPELATKFWIDSSPLTPANLRGKVVLLHFWAMWNTASTNQLERLNRWQTKFGERGFQVIGVTRLFGRSDRQDGLTSKEELASLEAFKKARNVRFPLAVAGLDDVTNDERFNSTALPMLILVDRQGLVRRIDRERTQYRKFERQLDKLTAARDAVGNK